MVKCANLDWDAAAVQSLVNVNTLRLKVSP